MGYAKYKTPAKGFNQFNSSKYNYSQKIIQRYEKGHWLHFRQQRQHSTTILPPQLFLLVILFTSLFGQSVAQVDQGIAGIGSQEQVLYNSLASQVISSATNSKLYTDTYPRDLDKQLDQLDSPPLLTGEEQDDLTDPLKLMKVDVQSIQTKPYDVTSVMTQKQLYGTIPFQLDDLRPFQSSKSDIDQYESFLSIWQKHVLKQIEQQQMFEQQITVNKISHVDDVSSLQTQTSKPQCDKLRWYISLDKESLETQLPLFVGAMYSAQENAPSLVPHIITNAHNHPILDWAAGRGAKICQINADFSSGGAYNKPKYFMSKFSQVSWLYLPFCNMYLKAKDDNSWGFSSSGHPIDPEMALFTDLDVQFSRDVKPCELQAPKVAAMSSLDQAANPTYSRVVYMNVTAYKADWKLFLGEVNKAKVLNLELVDKMFKEYFRSQVTPLAPWVLYNHINTEAAVVPFNGIKPKLIECAISNPLSVKQMCPSYDPALRDQLDLVTSPVSKPIYKAAMLEFRRYCLVSSVPLIEL